jgi:hypothetical protein
MKSKRVYITLNPERDKDRRILDYLKAAECSSGKAISVAVLNYLDWQDHSGEYAALLQTVRDTIRECFQTRSDLDSAKSLPTASAEDDENPVSPLDFIDAITGGCSFP